MGWRTRLLITILVVVAMMLVLTGSLAIAGTDQGANPVASHSNVLAADDVRFFPETGHSIAFGFKSFWEKNGGLRIFGFPITEEMTQNGMTVQYFERARFEFHPNNPEPFKVELGLLGDEVTTLQPRIEALEAFSQTQATHINPGLGTVMIEYGQRFADIWWALQAGNFDMAQYQIKEMREIQEVGEIDRPARAPALKAFETGFLDPLDAAVKAHDNKTAIPAYENAIVGCNDCHAGQTDSTFTSGFKFIKIQIPTSINRPFIDFAGQQ